jgi:hypothetical protein
MNGFDISQEESGIDIVKGWGGVFAFSQDQDAAAVNIVKDHVEVVVLIGITSIVEENVRVLLSSCPRGYANWFGGGIGRRKERRWIITGRFEWNLVIARWIIPKPRIGGG